MPGTAFGGLHVRGAGPRTSVCVVGGVGPGHGARLSQDRGFLSC